MRTLGCQEIFSYCTYCTVASLHQQADSDQRTHPIPPHQTAVLSIAMFARSAQRLTVTRLRISSIGSPFISHHSRGIVRSSSQWARNSRGGRALELAVAPASDESQWRMTAAALMAATFAMNNTQCEAPKENTPSVVASEDIEKVTALHNMDDMPVYSSDQVAENNGQDGKPIWMTYGGIVYDVTNFIPNHPGGSEQIIKAAGTVRYTKIMTRALLQTFQYLMMILCHSIGY